MVLLTQEIIDESGLPSPGDNMINRDVAVDRVGDAGYAAMHYFVSAGRVQEVKVLLAQGENVNFVNLLTQTAPRGQMPIELLVKKINDLFLPLQLNTRQLNNYTKLYNLLLEKGSQVALSNKTIADSMLIAPSRQQTVDQKGELYSTGYAPIHYFTSAVDVKVVEILLTHGTSVNLPAEAPDSRVIPMQLITNKIRMVSAQCKVTHTAEEKMRMLEMPVKLQNMLIDYGADMGCLRNSSDIGVIRAAARTIHNKKDLILAEHKEENAKLFRINSSNDHEYKLLNFFADRLAAELGDVILRLKSKKSADMGYKFNDSTLIEFIDKVSALSPSMVNILKYITFGRERLEFLTNVKHHITLLANSENTTVVIQDYAHRYAIYFKDGVLGGDYNHFVYYARGGKAKSIIDRAYNTVTMSKLAEEVFTSAEKVHHQKPTLDALTSNPHPLYNKSWNLIITHAIHQFMHHLSKINFKTSENIGIEFTESMTVPYPEHLHLNRVNDAKFDTYNAEIFAFLAKLTGSAPTAISKQMMKWDIEDHRYTILQEYKNTQALMVKHSDSTLLLIFAASNHDIKWATNPNIDKSKEFINYQGIKISVYKDFAKIFNAYHAQVQDAVVKFLNPHKQAAAFHVPVHINVTGYDVGGSVAILAYLKILELMNESYLDIAAHVKLNIYTYGAPQVFYKYDSLVKANKLIHPPIPNNSAKGSSVYSINSEFDLIPYLPLYGPYWPLPTIYYLKYDNNSSAVECSNTKYSDVSMFRKKTISNKAYERLCAFENHVVDFYCSKLHLLNQRNNVGYVQDVMQDNEQQEENNVAQHEREVDLGQLRQQALVEAGGYVDRFPYPPLNGDNLDLIGNLEQEL